MTSRTVGAVDDGALGDPLVPGADEAPRGVARVAADGDAAVVPAALLEPPERRRLRVRAPHRCNHTARV